MKSAFLPLVAIFLLIVGLVFLATQSYEQDTPVSGQQAAAAPHRNDMQTQDAKAFSGTIVKEKGKLVLKDTVAKVIYQLDDQDSAKQFEGKQVKVTGKLDLDTNLIHVENIENGS